jgi:hypothetical protein
MTRPENTSQRDPLLHLLGSLADGSGGYIERMEADGQRQLVNSDRLPATGRTGCDADEAFLALGFEFGDPDPADPLFRPATLPPGWARQASDHSMWSYIVDEHGRRRVAIFYKAAFYDRDAFMRLETVRSYAMRLVDDASSPIFDDVWCTREAFATALADIREQFAERVALYESRADDPGVPWAAEELAKSQAEVARVDRLAARIEVNHA